MVNKSLILASTLLLCLINSISWAKDPIEPAQTQALDPDTLAQPNVIQENLSFDEIIGELGTKGLDSNQIELLKANPKKINWYYFSLNPNEKAIEILNENLDKINWALLSRNKNAIEILKEWRLDRYYEGKAKLLDAAFQLKELP